VKRLMLVIVATVAVFVAITPQPASGVVHEIVGQWCSGHGELEPFGLSRDGSKNFAAPLVKAGVVSVHPYLDGLLIDFDFSKPQIKLAPTGNIVQITPPGVVPPLYIEEFVLGDRAPFTKCARLQS
jgi:hypothetical protein